MLKYIDFQHSLLILVLICVRLSYVNSANILALTPVGSPSHFLWNSVILHELGKRGHNVTILSPDLPKIPKDIPKTVHYIHLENLYNTMYESGDPNEKIDLNNYIGTPPHSDVAVLYEFGRANNKGVVTSKGFKQLLNYPDNFKFDLIIFDFTLNGPAIGFVHKFKYPPLVGISAFLYPPNAFDFIGGHFYTAYVPFYSLTCDVNMNFWQRLYNAFLFTYDTIYRQKFFNPTQDVLMRQYFPKNIPYIDELQEKMVLALVNSHPSINYPQPLPSNVIEIGGVQIQKAKPLEKDLEDFILKSKKGAILFSFGTNMKPEEIGPERAEIFMKVMEQFPDYHFLWKFDTNYIKHKIPSNVMVKTFYPQKDVLGHPKLKLFITHCGGLSTQEASWRGVPMLGVPLFVDQHRNLHKTVLAGAAVKVDYLSLNYDNFKSAINEILTNQSYAKNMKIRSKRFQDRPMSALDTAIWWIEYVLRHPNPDHLKSPVLRHGFFVANSLDILCFLVIIVICLIAILLKLFKMFLGLNDNVKKIHIKTTKKYK